MIIGLLFSVVAGYFVYREKQKADKAKQRSDELLLNILPKDVADELKTTGSSRARKFFDATVVFCDFIQFTQLSEQMQPEELVQVLDGYFKSFDKVVAGKGMEKIKTIGDAYMFVSGLPTPDPEHAVKAVMAALEMLEVMKSNPAGWQLRVGIHSGPVVAGIVGTMKFAYDIWGDTVNIAARIEQNSAAGKVNISQASFEMVKHHFQCTYRGKVKAKNKGELDMYFVENPL